MCIRDSMEVDTWTVEYEPMDVRNYALYLEVATAGGSYWKSNWWVTTISSSLTGGSPRRAVLIGKAVGGSPRFRRILQRMARGGARRRDDETTRQRQQFLAVVHPPTHSHMENISRSGTPPHSDSQGWAPVWAGRVEHRCPTRECIF